jgi:hypothetical protein
MLWEERVYWQELPSSPPPFRAMFTFLLTALVTAAVAFLGFTQAKRFVTSRLRFVDAIHKPAAPFLAGALALAAGIPFALLPIVGLSTAVVFGVSVGAGVASGAMELRRRLLP